MRAVSTFTNHAKKLEKTMINLNLLKSRLLERLKKAIEPLHLTIEQKLEIIESFDLSFESHRRAPRRATGEIYFMHVFRQAIRLIRLMIKYRVCSSDLICTVLLHDAIEDAEKGKTTRFMVKSQIHLRVNDHVVYLVLCLTKRKNIDTRDSYLVRLLKSELWEVYVAKPVDCNDNMLTLHATPKHSQMTKVREVYMYYGELQKRGTHLVTVLGEEGYIHNYIGWIALLNNVYRNLRKNAKKQKNRILLEQK